LVTGEQQIVTATARRVRSSSTASPDWKVVATVVCDQCGDHYQITHRSPTQDEVLGQRQATWLADKFVWDHIQENKHRASIDLPRSADLK
jgi:hypothetical protein